MGWRLATVWLLFLFVHSIANASDALILIHRENAGPNVPAALETHPTWILWPSTYPSQTENGLLSIFTGQDWVGNATYLQFKSAKKAQWGSQGYEALEKIGYLSQKARYLQGRSTPLIADAIGDSSPEAMLLSLSFGQTTVHARTWAGVAGENAIVVYQAHSWDDAAFVARRCGGKALVVEYPPEGAERWGRFWMLGNDWPDSGTPNSPDLKLAGLVNARDLTHLFTERESLVWTRGRQGPSPWLVRTTTFSPTVRGLYLAAVLLLIVFGTYLVRTERTSSLYRSCLLLVLGLPAIDLAAGSICSVVGLGAWLVIVPTLSCGLLGVLALADTLFSRNAESQDLSLQVVAGLGLIGCLVSNPFYSDYSPVLSGYGGPSYEALGLTGAYGLGVLMAIKKWSLRFGVVLLMIASSWFQTPDLSSCPNFMIAPLAIVSTLPMNWMVAVLMVPLAWICSSQALRFAWRPFGLIGVEKDLVGLDVSGLVFQLVSLPIVVCAAVAAGLGVSTMGFGHHQLWVSYRETPLLPALLTLAIYLLFCSLAIPGMVDSALVVILGCALVTFYVATK